MSRRFIFAIKVSHRRHLKCHVRGVEKSDFRQLARKIGQWDTPESVATLSFLRKMIWKSEILCAKGEFDCKTFSHLILKALHVRTPSLFG